MLAIGVFCAPNALSGLHQLNKQQIHLEFESREGSTCGNWRMISSVSCFVLVAHLPVKESKVRFGSLAACSPNAKARLGVRYLLEGSVASQGGVCAYAQLIDARPAPPWADRFDGEIEEILNANRVATEW